MDDRRRLPFSNLLNHLNYHRSLENVELQSILNAFVIYQILHIPLWEHHPYDAFCLSNS
uniref:Uncharacterized protein n=1 Tax=Rhizophora mucronata TaxID=61149 RepID=A0A2P2N2S2_RHIMU